MSRECCCVLRDIRERVGGFHASLVVELEFHADRIMIGWCDEIIMRKMFLPAQEFQEFVSHISVWLGSF